MPSLKLESKNLPKGFEKYPTMLIIIDWTNIFVRITLILPH